MMKISVLAAVLALGALSDEAWATDSDGDGHHSIATGGDDCDDSNGARHPGHYETCDTVDNDCDPSTVGDFDADGDGFVSGACCNVQYYRLQWNGTRWVPVPVLKCGTDCDDTNMSLVLNSQRCEAGTQRVEICGGPASPTDDGWYALDCGGGMTCAAQPNGTGVCR